MYSLSKHIIVIGLLFIIIGLFFFWERNKPNRVSFADYSSTIYASYNDYPVKITIPSIDIELPIKSTTISKNSWNTHNDAVSYLDSSPVPGTNGNSILYGHNWNNLLGSLRYVQPSDDIIIEFASGKRLNFVISTMGTVTPDQTHVLLPSDDVRITLYTCSGIFDNKRLVVTALLTNTISTNSNHKGVFGK